MGEPSWRQSHVFPIIARVIASEHQCYRRFITTQEIAASLLRDPEARATIETVQGQQQGWSPEHTASNMVAWFSQRITVGQSEWQRAFERMKMEDGQWAYKPSQTSPP